MSVVAPVAGVGGAVLPVVAGIALGERVGVLMLIGLVVGLPAIWLVSSSEPDPSGVASTRWLFDRGVLLGGGAGAAFALSYVALDQISGDAGLWPLFAMQGVSTLCVPLLALYVGERVFPVPRDAWRVWYAGPVGAVVCAAFFFAASQGMLAISAVLASLNPAFTIALAVLLLHERVTRAQGVGLVLAGACVALVIAG